MRMKMKFRNYLWPAFDCALYAVTVSYWFLNCDIRHSHCLRRHYFDVLISSVAYAAASVAVPVDWLFESIDVLLLSNDLSNYLSPTSVNEMRFSLNVQIKNAIREMETAIRGLYTNQNESNVWTDVIYSNMSLTCVIYYLHICMASKDSECMLQK